MKFIWQQIQGLIIILIFLNIGCSYLPNNQKTKDMVHIPAGQFKMGITQELAESIVNEAPGYSSINWFKSEMPKHKVWINEYYIDKYEVTFGEYRNFVNASGYVTQGDWKKHFKDGMENYPVHGVTWQDAYEYAKFYSKRLPTEAEWERAAKCDKDYLYPWGDELIMGQDNCQDYELTPVGQFPPNEFGIYDLGGNVQEWYMDWYNTDFYYDTPSKNPKGPKEGHVKVIRGASIKVNCAYYAHTGYRGYADSTDLSTALIGFRCVYSPN